jgi:hypothetical protein
LVCLAALSIASLNNGTSKSLPNLLRSLNTVSLKSSRNPLVTSTVTGGIKIAMLSFKIIIDNTADQ